MSSMGRIKETAERRDAARVPLSAVPALPPARAVLRPAAEAVEALADEWTALAATGLRAQCLCRALVRRRGLAHFARGARDPADRGAARRAADRPAAVRDRPRLCAASRPGRPELVPRPGLSRHASGRGRRGEGLLGRRDRRARTPPICRPTSSICGACAKAGRSSALWAPRPSTAGSALSFRATSPPPLITSRRCGRRSARSCGACATGWRISARSRRAFSTTAPSSTPGATPSSPSKRPAGRARKGPRSPASRMAKPSSAELVAAAWDEGRLQFRRLDVDGRPVAMLVNFLCPPGSFSFKTAFDEDFAHYSPGVLLQIDNLDILDRPGHRLDGQLRRPGSSDDRLPVDRAARRSSA